MSEPSHLPMHFLEKSESPKIDLNFGTRENRALKLSPGSRFFLFLVA